MNDDCTSRVLVVKNDKEMHIVVFDTILNKITNQEFLMTTHEYASFQLEQSSELIVEEDSGEVRASIAYTLMTQHDTLGVLFLHEF